MSKASDVLNVARSFIGVKESPKNSNNVKFNTDFYGKEVKGASYPWCCAFIWDIFKIAGASKLFYDGGKTASCENLLQFYKIEKQIVPSPIPGDLVFYQFDKDVAADHIGIIESVNANGSFIAIEGNTAIGNDANGGEVMRRTRSNRVVKAFARPKYDTEVIVAKNPYREPTTTIKFGTQGNVARWVQWELVRKGYKILVDGDFGNKSVIALKDFQFKNNLTVDGICGEKTRAYLKK